jgi:hypothetical protein
MRRFIEGRDRAQATLFPERLDEATDADNQVRVVDALIDALDLAELGFDVDPEATGRPAIIRQRCSGSVSTVISTRSSRRADWSASADATSS